MIQQFFAVIVQVLLPQALEVLSFWSPIWVPILVVYVAWNIWIRYTRAKFLSGIENVLLEIKLPRETIKSPLAMELFINSLHQTGGEATWYDTYFKGKARAVFSLELVSLEGKIHFYIYARKVLRNWIESNLYSQFPNISIAEVPDYTATFKYQKDKISLWGCDFKPIEPDVYPIKTYIDYGLGDDPKEEYKIDPLTPTLEFLGSLGKGEQLWIQIVIRAAKKDHVKAWKKSAKEEIEKIRQESLMDKDDDSSFARFPNPTKGQSEVISAIERNIAKNSFQVGIRGIYLAKSENFKGITIPGLLSSWKHYNSNNLNGFRPTRGMIKFDDYPWEDYKEIRKNRERRNIYESYRRRCFFHPPFMVEPFYLNTESLATIYHFPGSVAGTPTLDRIPSKRAEAPFNLPV